MFQNPFSFSGRIRRTEYGLSYIIYMACITLISMVSGFLSGSGILTGPLAAVLMGIFFIPAGWFLLAQGSKRCHDRGNSGIFQLIPLYFFWMLFAPGEEGSNEFGADPKAEPEVDFLME